MSRAQIWFELAGARMIRLQDLTVSRGGIDLLRDASTLINPGDRLALIGPNGSGKTTLLKVLSGEVLPDRGTLEMPRLRLSVLEQVSPAGENPAWRHVLSADDALERARDELTTAETGTDGMAIAQAHDAWQQAGGSDAEPRARALLAGLGFEGDMADRPVDALSGGWRMRLNLARALFRPSDLLLLDEPTNHLDLDAILWLEQRLRRLESTLIVVSHDRDFLDAVVNGTLSIEGQSLIRYRGGYSACEHQRAERLSGQLRQDAQVEREKQRLQGFIDRFRAQATKARQVQSRLKAMQRLPAIAPLAARRRLQLGFAAVGDMPNPVMRVEDLSAGYGDTPVLEHVGLTIERGARVGLLGRNGHGKTTLVRTLIGELPALAGRFTRAPSLRVGYFAQDAIDRLPGQLSPLELMRALSQRLKGQPDPDGALRDWLGRFGFRDDDALRACGPMSGGEKARLVLAQTLWQAPQLLVLDEPTNHLDADTRDALTEALLEFDGVLLLVSHDRHLLATCVDRFVLVADGRASEFDGDLADYAQWLQQRPARAMQRPSPDDAADAGSRRERRRESAAQREKLAQALRPLKKEMAKLDGDMARLQQELSALDARLADPVFYHDGNQADQVLQDRARLAARLDELEQRWLANAERQERISASENG
ncbi:MAG: ATP-binding cassette domain-containing protein [Burkholderiaceae bacterium]